MRKVFRAIWKALFGKGGSIETLRETTSVEFYQKNWDFGDDCGVVDDDDGWGLVMGRITGTPPCVWK